MGEEDGSEGSSGRGESGEEAEEGGAQDDDVADMDAAAAETPEADPILQLLQHPRSAAMQAPPWPGALKGTLQGFLNTNLVIWFHVMQGLVCMPGVPLK